MNKKNYNFILIFSLPFIIGACTTGYYQNKIDKYNAFEIASKIESNYNKDLTSKNIEKFHSVFIKYDSVKADRHIVKSKISIYNANKLDNIATFREDFIKSICRESETKAIFNKGVAYDFNISFDNGIKNTNLFIDKDLCEVF
ncbi:hypothetical protein [Arcobacter roscoffensis]|uniref:Lipoprotein n=1 Tax=Arcobacter roscoffensis TaxID=2961520 RepID=A0ABY5E2P7_9BACT|nr:hypothetical protein [Arcobacter roscoffensis]UTJ05410.1 hypothetical protein NJU99_09025 [Arcobacter roscoffensis]